MENHGGHQAEYRRIYRCEHPLAIWFTGGIAFVGIVAILFPETIQQSAASAALPDWLLKVFYVCYFGGGALSCYALMTAKHAFEAAGMAVLSSALLAQWIALVWVAIDLSAGSVVSATFVLTLAIGCGLRSYRLAKPS